MIINPEFDLDAYHTKQTLPDRNSSSRLGSILAGSGREERGLDDNQEKRTTGYAINGASTPYFLPEAKMDIGMDH